MARVSEQDVKDILETAKTTLQIAPFLRSANLIVTNSLGSTDLSDATLAEIEKWVAAHLVTIMAGGQVIEERVGDVATTYATSVDWKTVGLYTTLYGKQALMLDTTGRLADLGKKKAYLEVLNDDDSGYDA